MPVQSFGHRPAFNQEVVEGYLASDNVLNWKVAEFLNTTGFPIHMKSLSRR